VLGLRPERTTVDFLSWRFRCVVGNRPLGRIRRQNEAARAGLVASQKRNVASMTLLAKSRGIHPLLNSTKDWEIAHRTEKSFERTSSCSTISTKTVSASKLEVSRASAALHSVSATIPDLETNRLLSKRMKSCPAWSEPQSRAREKLLLTKRRCPKFQLVCLRCSSNADRHPRGRTTLRAASARIACHRWRFLFPDRFDRAIWWC